VADDEALDHLVRRYLAAFGPAPRADIAAWAGPTQGALAAPLGRLRLRRFGDEDGHEPLDLPRAPRPSADTPGALLMDGVVAGVWRHRGRRIDVEPFVRLAAAEPRGARRGGRSAGRPPRLAMTSSPHAELLSRLWLQTRGDADVRATSFSFGMSTVLPEIERRLRGAQM